MQNATTTAGDVVPPFKLIRAAITRGGELKWPMLDVIIVVVVAPLVIMIFLYSLWRFRRRQQQVFLAIRNANGGSLDGGVLSYQELDDQLPVRSFDKSKLQGRDCETCAVCLEDFEDGDEMRRLIRCGHDFHIKCIDPVGLPRVSVPD